MQSWIHWHIEVRARATGKSLPSTLAEIDRNALIFGESAPTKLETQIKNAKPDQPLVLLHAQRLAHAVLTGSDPMAQAWKTTPAEALALIDRLSATYKKNEIPALGSPHALDFFNTLRSENYPSHYPVALELKSDHRGSLFEAVRTHQMGQTFLSSTKVGAVRGNHFHLHKLERFCVVSGNATIRIRKILDRTVKEFPVSGDRPCFIDIPTLHTHDITNTGTTELITLFWTHEFYDPENPDTWKESVV